MKLLVSIVGIVNFYARLLSVGCIFVTRTRTKVDTKYLSIVRCRAIRALPSRRHAARGRAMR
ncbi:protein of unknown function [Burkholderia multivorans]